MEKKTQQTETGHHPHPKDDGQDFKYFQKLHSASGFHASRFPVTEE
jgi:hypothetical protein